MKSLLIFLGLTGLLFSCDQTPAHSQKTETVAHEEHDHAKGETCEDAHSSHDDHEGHNHGAKTECNDHGDHGAGPECVTLQHQQQARQGQTKASRSQQARPINAHDA